MWNKALRMIDGASDPPFTVVSRRLKALPNGDFTPAAEISFGPGAAASGLFTALKSSDLQTLIAVLSLVNANGRVRPTCHLVAAALKISAPHAFIRLLRLTAIKWRGQPLLVRVGSFGDMVVYVPSAQIIAQRLAPKEPLVPEDDNIIVGAGRDRVYAESRARYARKREDVERELVETHGWPFSEESEVYADYMREPEPNLIGDDRHARQRLMRLGVDHKTADDLVRRFGRDRVARQVAYLPFRKAKDKVKLLVSSVEGDYEPPSILSDKR